jgi:hypothetical protein
MAAYGDRRFRALLARAGWVVKLQRVERIWRREWGEGPPKHGSCLKMAESELRALNPVPG